MRERARRRQGGFTLLEIIIALGILAIGATTALALLVAATATGRRAEHLVNAALVADSVLSDVEANLDGAFGQKQLDALEVIPHLPRATDLADGPLRAAPYYDPKAAPTRLPTDRPTPSPPPKNPKAKPSPSPSPQASASPAPGPRSSDDPGSVTDFARAYDDDPFAQAKTYLYAKDKTLEAYPDYKYEVTISPVGGPPDDPWEFLIEITVRWSEKGNRCEAVYQTIFLKKLSWLDVKPQ